MRATFERRRFRELFLRLGVLQFAWFRGNCLRFAAVEGAFIG